MIDNSFKSAKKICCRFGCDLPRQKRQGTGMGFFIRKNVIKMNSYISNFKEKRGLNINLRQIFADWWQALLNLLFPACRCIYCGQERIIDASGLCQDCQNIFEKGQSDFTSCILCPIFIPLSEKYCANCRLGQKHSFDGAVAVFPYGGAIRDVIHDFKYRGAVKWARPLGLLMKERVKKDARFIDINMVIPVPLHEHRLKLRGYNQSELLAKEISRELDLPLAAHALCRFKDTPSQTGLTKTRRHENLLNAFQIKDANAIKGKNILLVDDIYTTGATVESCAQIMKNGGAKSVYVVTCAAGKRY